MESDIAINLAYHFLLGIIDLDSLDVLDQFGGLNHFGVHYSGGKRLTKILEKCIVRFAME